MAQINLDSARTAGKGNHTVTASSDTTFTLAGLAGISVDNTATKFEVNAALRAAIRNMNRNWYKIVAPAQLPTSGSDQE